MGTAGAARVARDEMWPALQGAWRNRYRKNSWEGAKCPQQRRASMRVQRRAGADGRLPPRHRCAQAQRPHHDLWRARHPDHRLRAHGAGRGHPRPLVPPRAERRLRRVHRRLPDEEARHLPHGVGARLPQRPDRARARHHQLLPDDPDLGLLRARDRRPAAGRLRGDGPARHRQAAVQGGLPRAACRRTSASASRARSARRCRAVRAASISICRPSCSAR